MEIRSCRPSERDQLVCLLDEEFVFGKARTISLLQRFPNIYHHDNLHNILVGLDKNEIVSALSVRQFDWRTDGETFRGAMIGAVYTRPARRGQGFASSLLNGAAKQLRERGTDFGVLWSMQQSFYARLGWAAGDCSVFGEIEPGNFAVKPAVGVTLMPASAGALLAEGVRQRCCNNMLLRCPEDYRQLPLPADSMDLLWKEDSQGTAYALLGKNSDAGFLYELDGYPDHFPALWQAACSNHRRIFVNDRSNSASYHWLTGHTKVALQKKDLTMWLPLSKRVSLPRLTQWHIPYFDRI